MFGSCLLNFRITTLTTDANIKMFLIKFANLSDKA